MYFINLRRRFVSDSVWYSLGAVVVGVGLVIEGNLALRVVGSILTVVGMIAAWTFHRRAAGTREGKVRAPRKSGPPS